MFMFDSWVRTLGRTAAAAVAVGAIAEAATAQGPQPAPTDLPAMTADAMPIPAAPSADPVATPAYEVLASPAVPAAPCADCADACPTCQTGFDFKNVPVTRPLPKFGNFPVAPAGPGYYSVLDTLTGNYRKAPPKYAYPRFGLIAPSFFDTSFAYLDNPKNTDTDYLDFLHRIRLGENWLFNTGGDIRMRYEDRYNARLTERNDSYLLTRTRAYGDLWYQDKFRLYAEYIGAWQSGNELPPLPIDENYSDILNLFIDLHFPQHDGCYAARSSRRSAAS